MWRNGWGIASLGTYQADTVSVRGEAWKDLSFSEYDVVFHVAGIAHVSANPKMKDLYFAVNRGFNLGSGKKGKRKCCILQGTRTDLRSA